MTLAHTLLIAGALLLAGAWLDARPVAQGNPVTQGNEVGRFQITGSDTRVWRVDTVTGQMHTCYRVRRNGEHGFRCISVR